MLHAWLAACVFQARMGASNLGFPGLVRSSGELRFNGRRAYRREMGFECQYRQCLYAFKRLLESGGEWAYARLRPYVLRVRGSDQNPP